jgi:hypothetical protein
MALDLTPATLRALNELSIEPNISFKIEGFDTIFSAKAVKDYLLYGCPDIYYGDPDLFYGGLKDVENNETLLDSLSTTYTIQQQINYDDAEGSSISSMTLGLVDKNELVTQLISPGIDVEDILGRKISVYLTFGDVSFFDDSTLVFRGVVTKIDSIAGLIKFKVNHPDNKKQVELFKIVETQLDGLINASQTSVQVIATDNYINEQGPLTTYIRIDNELIRYTGFDATNFTGLTRGELGSLAIAHDDGAQVRALYCLEGNPLDLALQIMMSGHGVNPVHSGIPATSFRKIGSGTTQVDNAIYFDQINLPEDFGISAGDTITTTLATNGANNVTTRTVLAVEKFESGYYITVDGAALVLEDTTSAVMDMFSQYNVLPDGMRMKPDECDIAEHLKIRDFFHSSTQMRIYLKEDALSGKEFLDKQLYQPIACYSLPRKAQASVGYTVGPIPGEDIKTLDATNVKNPDRIEISRTTNRAFFNEVVYKYNDSPLASDEKFNNADILISQTSKNRILGTTKTFTIESSGLRTDLNAQNIIASNGNRILDRYKFGAEMVKLKTLMRVSAGLEVGDIVVGDFKALKISDTTKGSRQFDPRLFEIQNKTINLKTGEVDLVLLDTGLNLASRFGLSSPCSPIAGIISSSQFVIGPDAYYPSKYGADEFLKWVNIPNITNPMSIRVHNADYSIDEDLVVTSITENTFLLQDPASITLAVGMIVEFTGYVDSDTSDKQKLVYAYMTDDPNFPDAGVPYTMI